MRWVGIDEAGYGPNLGPLVMTAVIAQSCNHAPGVASSDDHNVPDLWRDLALGVDRAGGDISRLWLDDSKRILTGGKGRDRLDLTTLTLLGTATGTVPASLADLLAVLGAGDLDRIELSHWLDRAATSAPWPQSAMREEAHQHVTAKSLHPVGGGWSLVAVRSVVLAPALFNERLEQTGGKARVHFSMFRELLHFAWALSADGVSTAVTSDKHGGRHYYLEPLYEAFPDVWIDRGAEGPERSEYELKDGGRRLSLTLIPRADANHGLVALASIVSKTVRECWMDQFNAFWTSRVPGLRPTAGYPVDATRFRKAIEPLARNLGLEPNVWWRTK